MKENTRAVDMPSLPLGAQEEIMDKLFSDMHISSDDIVKILKKYEVEGDVETLQDSYRRRVGQRLMASIRDESGKREVLFGKGREYFVVECCNDAKQLNAIRSRIEAQMVGLGMSADKVHGRLGVLERLGRLFRKKKGEHTG